MPQDRHNGRVGVALLVDRSLTVPEYVPELFELRNRLVAELQGQLGPRLAAVVAYSDVARTVSCDEAAIGAVPRPADADGCRLSVACPDECDARMTLTPGRFFGVKDICGLLDRLRWLFDSWVRPD